MDINIKVKSQAESASKALNRTKTAVSGLGSSYRKTGRDTEEFYAKTKKLNNSFNNITKDANRSANSLVNLGKSMKGLNQLFGMGKMYAYGQGLAQVIQSAVDMIEQTNLFNVAMGDLAVQTGKFVDKMHQAYGFDNTNAESAIGTYNLLARSMGMTNEQASTLSTNMYKLAVDYSSLTNVPLNQVMQDFRSGLVGQTETVYKYGLDITEATLKQEAYLKGISKSVRNMSQGEKMALRYSAMIRQSALAQGDFARTVNTPANQLKIMTERFVTLSRSIGSMFIPALTAVLPYVNAFLQVLNNLFQAIARFFGYKPPEIKNGIGNQMGTLSDDAENAGDAIGGVTDKLKKMKQVTLGMDELNVIPDQSDSGANGDGTSGAGVSAVPFDLTGYNNMMDTITQKSDVIASAIEKMLGKFKELSSGLVNINWNPMLKSLDTLWGALKPFGETIGKGLAYLYENVLVPIGVWAMEKGVPAVFELLASVFNALNEVCKALAPVGATLIEVFFKPLGEFVGMVVILVIEALTVAFNALAGAVKEHPVLFQTLVTYLGAIFGVGLLVTKTVNGLILGFQAFKTALTVAKTATSVFSAVTISSVGLVGIAIGALIGIAILIITHWDEVKAFFIECWDKITVVWGQLGQWFTDNVATPLGVVKDDVVLKLTELKNWFGAIWDNITLVWGKAGEWFTTNVSTPLSNIFKGIANFVIGYWNNIIAGFESALNFIIGGINTFISWVDTLVEKVNSISSKIGIKVKFNMSPIDNVALGRIPALANGGSLQRGQLFEAGEFGKAEMLGSYNNKTTVMPLENTDFVSAIYTAVLDAMTEASSGGTVVENVVNLDGEVIYKNQQKVATSRGHNFDMGAFKR